MALKEWIGSISKNTKIWAHESWAERAAAVTVIDADGADVQEANLFLSAWVSFRARKLTRLKSVSRDTPI
jgi:hypothetical protein